MQNYLEYLSANKSSIMLILSAYFQYSLSAVVILRNRVLKAWKCPEEFQSHQKDTLNYLKIYFRKFSRMKYFNMLSKLTSNNLSTIIPLESSIPGQAHEDLLGWQKGAAKLLLPPPALRVSSGQRNADIRKSLIV